MIYTCTTNPSLDYYITVPNQLIAGENNRSDMEMYEAGGKGVNVSIVLNNFRIPSVCMGFLGGFTRDFYLTFIANYPNVQPLFTTIADNTRINVKIMDSKYETSINAKGPHITDEEFARFKSRLGNIYTDDIFVLSGNIEEEIKDRMIDLVHELCSDGVKVVLDTDLDILERCLDVRPFIVKLNDRNLKDDLEKTAKEYIERGVENVIYSAPHKASYIFTKEKTLMCESLNDSLFNLTGSADSMVAGFIAGYLSKQDYEEAFYMGLCTGSASAFSDNLATKPEVQALLNQLGRA